jgi:NAD(P)H-hydrate repair Nnr-like enzyme with NAD(P)H-hydrate epimerase domain
MSDSEGDRPSEATLARKLREVVIAIHKTGKTEDLTVKRVRARAEKELGLDEGFFKADSSWKQKSQDQIVDAVVGTSALGQ